MLKQIYLQSTYITKMKKYIIAPTFNQFNLTFSRNFNKYIYNTII